MAKNLIDLTVNELEAVLLETKTVIVPVGIVEQHGFHLPLGVDIHNAEQVLRRAADRLDAVIAPTVPYAYSGGELTGTINISPQVFALFMSDICSELVRIGFKNLVILLGHAGTDNLNALKSTLQMFLKRNPQSRDCTLSLVPVWDLSPTWLDFFRMEPEHDFHAGQVETSLMLYWRPDQVRETIIVDEPEISRMMRTDQDWFEASEKALDHPFIVPRTFQRDSIKVGVMGFPEKASRELGERICGEMVEGLVAYLALLTDK